MPCNRLKCRLNSIPRRGRLAVHSLGRRLRYEPLEERRLLSITVNTLVDEADGSIVDGDISLRDAIAAALAGETIDFAVTGKLDLTLGELAISVDLNIFGPGADQLTIDAGDPAAEAGNGNVPPFDQRGPGFDRELEGRIDIGVYEGEVPNSADFDDDGDIDGRDFLAWQRGFGKSSATKSNGDANKDMLVDGADLVVWQDEDGTVEGLRPAVEGEVLGDEGFASEPGSESILTSELLDIALASVYLRETPDEGIAPLLIDVQPLDEAAVDVVFSGGDDRVAAKPQAAGDARVGSGTLAS